MQRQVARGIDEHCEPDPARQQRVERSEPVELQVQPQIPTRRPRHVHRAAARGPAPQRSPEGEEGEYGPDLRRKAGLRNPGEQGNRRGQESQNERRQDGKRLQRRARRPTRNPPGAVWWTGRGVRTRLRYPERPDVAPHARRRPGLPPEGGREFVASTPNPARALPAVMGPRRTSHPRRGRSVYQRSVIVADFDA